MPGLVKIGFTTRTVTERIAELHAMTGVPAPFILEAYFTSSQPAADETKGQTSLAPMRLANKEFFNCSVKEAIEAMERVLGRAPAFVFRKIQRAKIPQAKSSSHLFQGGRCIRCGYTVGSQLRGESRFLCNGPK